MTAAILIFLAGLFYILSLAAAFKSGGDAGKFKVSFYLALVGFLFHTAAIILRTIKTGSAPVSTSYDLLETIAWAFVLVQLLCASVFKIGLVGIFSMLPAAVLTMLPLGCPSFLSKMDAAAKPVAHLSTTHAALAAVSYALLAVAAIMGAMYIKQKKSLIEKSCGHIARMLPPLDTLARGISTMLGGATILMMASLAVGIIAAVRVQMTSFPVVKFTSGILLFLLMSALYALAATSKISGARLAWLSILLAVIALIMLIPIEIGL